MKVRLPNQGGNRQEMLRQLQKAQEDMEKKQAELEAAEYEVTSGGGMVKVTIRGDKQITSLTIAPEAVGTEPEDIEMMQDMIIAAVNEAIAKVESAAADEMSKITGSLPNIPGLM